MPHFEFYELSPEAKREATCLRSQIAGNEMLLALYRLEALLRKANFNPNQPRVPAGTSDGEQWTAMISIMWLKKRSLRMLDFQNLSSKHLKTA